MVALTIGMATYNDFEGVYFSLQALRLYQDVDDTELIVVDNFGCPLTKQIVDAAGGFYVLATEVQGTAAPRDLVFRLAEGDAVLCLDSHVLFAPEAIARLKAYYRDHPESCDLLQGPLLADDLDGIATHFDPVWRGQMWGVWGNDPRGEHPDGEPFEIVSQGLGVFSCRRETWPGFNPRFRGFGGEEGYLHEKFRRAGGRALCLPFLMWIHRFGRPRGVPYPLLTNDKLRNYVIGLSELGLDLAPAVAHFAEHLPSPELYRDVRCAVIECYGSVAASPAATQGIVADLAARATASGLPPAPDRFLTPPGAAAVTDYARVAIHARPAQPRVSCLCPTFNRPSSGRQWLIEEAVESFLRQDYPHKELIVLNDTPGQTLAGDLPGVRIVNTETRYPSLGDKRNALAELATGELLCPWDDDDISLPWRLSLSVARLGDEHYFNPRAYWFLNGETLCHDHAPGTSQYASIFSRHAYAAVAGTPSINQSEDQVIAERLRRYNALVADPAAEPTSLDIADWFYLYRWGVSDMHLSSAADPALWDNVATKRIMPGQVTLRPRWRTDYTALTRHYLVTHRL